MRLQWGLLSRKLCALLKREASLKGLKRMQKEGKQRGLEEAQSCKGTLKGTPKGAKSSFKRDHMGLQWGASLKEPLCCASIEKELKGA